MNQKILFTDIDGTLLDADSYSFSDSLSSVQRLLENNVPIIFCSSKTRSEQIPLRQKLKITSPFITENGSEVIIPSENHSIILGVAVEIINQHLEEIRNEMRIDFKSFSELSVSEVAKVTGLDSSSANLAREREYSQTIVSSFNKEEKERFFLACANHNLKCFSGGRFITVTGANADKGNAVKVLIDYYQKLYGKVATYGIGDSPNDAPMLQAVDKAFLVQKPDETWSAIGIEIPNLIRLKGTGPKGFQLAAQYILE